MAPKTVVYVTVAVPALILVLRDGGGSGAVTHAAEHRTRTFAHVLQNYVALEVGVVAAVLSSPFDWKLGADIVLESTHVDAATAVVLGIEQSIRVVSIAVGLVEPAIGYFRSRKKKRFRGTCCWSHGDCACICHKGQAPKMQERKWRIQSSA